MTEFRNTPPRVHIPGRSSAELLEDLCIALRNVAVYENYWSVGPDPPRVQEAVSIATELERRQVDVSERLDRLSQETRWLMKELLDDCRKFPAVIPRVRELDGIRRYLRCGYCRSAERPENDTALSACDACLRNMIESFDSLNAIEGTVLFRTYTSQWRCEHADENTVLVGAIYEEEALGSGKCRRCLENALAERGGPAKKNRGFGR